MSGPETAPASLSKGSYRLLPHQVPDNPESSQWVDLLRWCVAIMNSDDCDIGFAASLLYYAFDKGGLTEKQARHGKRLVERVQALWIAGALDCQRVAVPGVSTGLLEMDAKGCA